MQKFKKSVTIKLLIALYLLVLPLLISSTILLSSAKNTLMSETIHRETNSLEMKISKFNLEVDTMLNAMYNHSQIKSLQRLYQGTWQDNTKAFYMNEFADINAKPYLVNSNFKRISIMVNSIEKINNSGMWVDINQEQQDFIYNNYDKNTAFKIIDNIPYLFYSGKIIDNTPQFVMIAELDIFFVESYFGEDDDLLNYSSILYDYQGKLLYGNLLSEKVLSKLMDFDIHTKSKSIISDNRVNIAGYSVFNQIIAIKSINQKEFFNKAASFEIFSYFYIGFAVVLLFILTIYIMKTVKKPLDKLYIAFERGKRGELNTKIDYKFSDQFGYLYDSFLEMQCKQSELTKSLYIHKILKQQAELKYLENQINPHFLYNTYFTLYSFAEAEGSEMVADFAKKLGEYFKYVANSKNDLVTLEEELKHLQVYYDIQKIRFRSNLELKILNVQNLNFCVPKLTLQQLFENSMKYGYDASEQKNSLIEISIEEIENTYIISYKDLGKGMSQEKIDILNETLKEEFNINSKFGGLTNLQYRIKFYYGENSGITVSANKDFGITIKITFMKKLIK